MIVVTSARTDIAIEVIEGGVFEPEQTAVLKMAYEQAARTLAADYHLTDPARAKLARTILRLGRISVASGRDLAVDPDVKLLASAASLHLLSVNAEQAQRLLLPALPFEARPSHTGSGLRKRDGGPAAAAEPAVTGA